MAGDEDGDARGVDGAGGAGGGDAGEVVAVGVGEEAVALEGGGGGPRVHREGQPPRQLDRHGLSLPLRRRIDDAGGEYLPRFLAVLFGWREGRIVLARPPKILSFSRQQLRTFSLSSFNFDFPVSREQIL